MHLGVCTAVVLFCLLGIPTVASPQTVPPEIGTRIRLTVP